MNSLSVEKKVNEAPKKDIIKVANFEIFKNNVLSETSLMIQGRCQYTLSQSYFLNIMVSE